MGFTEQSRPGEKETSSHVKLPQVCCTVRVLRCPWSLHLNPRRGILSQQKFTYCSVMILGSFSILWGTKSCSPKWEKPRRVSACEKPVSLHVLQSKPRIYTIFLPCYTALKQSKMTEGLSAPCTILYAQATSHAEPSKVQTEERYSSTIWGFLTPSTATECGIKNAESWREEIELKDHR